MNPSIQDHCIATKTTNSGTYVVHRNKVSAVRLRTAQAIPTTLTCVTGLINLKMAFVRVRILNLSPGKGELKGHTSSNPQPYNSQTPYNKTQRNDDVFQPYQPHTYL